jgi:branched-chain amino acid transport system substrate-binding protein
MTNLPRAASLGLAVGLSAALTGCSGGALSSSNNSDSGPIMMAILTSKTGALATYGPDKECGVKAGVAIATHGTNEVAGRKIQFVVGDNKSDVGQSTTVARQILQQDHPDIVFGFDTSDAALATEPIWRDSHIVDINPIAASDGLSNYSPTTFRVGRDSTQESLIGSKVVDMKPGETFQVLAPDYAYGQSAAKAWQKLLLDQGGKAAGEPVFAPQNASDYTGAVQQVKSRNPDKVVVVSFQSATAPLLWKSINTSGLADSAAVYTLLPRKDTRKGMGLVAQKVHFFAIYDPNIVDTAENKKFVEEFHRICGGTEPDIYAGDPGVAGQVAVHALEETGGSTDPKKLQDALEGLTGSGIKGAYKIREDHVFLGTFYEARVNEDYDAELVKALPMSASDRSPVPPKQ